MTARPERLPQRNRIMHLLHPERGFRSGLFCVIFSFFEIKSQIAAFYSVIIYVGGEIGDRNPRPGF